MFEPGTEINGRYRISYRLDGGGMGIVYVAQDLHIQNLVALKVLKDLDPDAAFEELLNEIRTAIRIKHDNVCRILDLKKAEGVTPFLVMEYVEGSHNLDSFLQQIRRPSQEQALRLSIELCDGLAAIHEGGVIHRDLKPSNVLVNKSGHLKITDFGIATFLGAQEGATGTPEYMAPELLSGDTNVVSPEQDIYSLGLVLYHIFTGRLKPVSDLQPGFLRDSRIESIILRCLSNEPEDRPSSAQEVAALLKDETKPQVAKRTVVFIDLARYTPKALAIYRNLNRIEDLDKEINQLVDKALQQIPGLEPQYLIRERLGDGQILLFKSEDTAHDFAVKLHETADTFNAGRDEESALRHFRIGIASGEVTLTKDRNSSIAYAYAARLESACRTGEILVSDKTWSQLTEGRKALYSPEPESIQSKHGEEWEAYSYQNVVEPAPWDRQEVILACSISIDDLGHRASQDSEEPSQKHYDWYRDALITPLESRFNGLDKSYENGCYSFLIVNIRDAVRFALDHQRFIAQENHKEGPNIVGRVAIYKLDWQRKGTPSNQAVQEARRASLELLAVSQGQIFLSGPALDTGREDPALDPEELFWTEHGTTVLLGWDKPIRFGQICERSSTATVTSPPGKPGRWIPARNREVPAAPGWKLTKKLGQGGFGEVWLARRTESPDGIDSEQRLEDPEPNVCVFKFANDRKHIESLRKERDLLSHLQHFLGDRDDIVKLVGFYLDDEPSYLRSTFAPHGNLQAWIEQNVGLRNLSRKERIRLIIQIATALDAAHEFGVVHGDLKPSNVLVAKASTGHSSSRGPHIEQLQLSDFGLGVFHELQRQGIKGGALVEQLRLTASSTSSTATWTYTAPELLEGTSGPTPASDVYSLGVLSYQILVANFHKTAGAGWGKEIDSEVLRQDLEEIFDTDPKKRPPISKIIHRLEQLESRERAFRATQLASENRKKLTWAAASFFITLFAIYSIYNHRVTQRALEDSEYTLEFLVDSFRIADPQWIAEPNDPKGLEVTVEEVLEFAERRIQPDPNDPVHSHPRVRASILDSIGSIYRNLGWLNKSEPLLKQGLEIRQGALGSDSIETSKSLLNLGQLKLIKSDLEEAERDISNSLKIRKRYRGKTSLDIANALSALSAVLNVRGQYEKATELSERAHSIYKDQYERELSLESAARYAKSLSDLGTLLRQRGQFDTALQLHREALSIAKQKLPEHPLTADLMDSMAQAFVDAQQDLQKAKDLAHGGLTLRMEIFNGKDHPELVKSKNQLGIVSASLGNTAEAMSYFEEALKLQNTIFGADDDHLGTAEILSNRGLLQLREGRFPEAYEDLQRALEIAEAHLGPAQRFPAFLRTNIAQVLWFQGSIGEAEAELMKAEEILSSRTWSDESGDRAVTLNIWGLLLKWKGDFPEAKLKLCEAIHIREHVMDEQQPILLADTKNSLGLVLDSMGQYFDAKIFYRQSLDIYTDNLPNAADYLLATVKNNLAYVLTEIGDFYNELEDEDQANIVFAEAERLFVEALETYRRSYSNEGHPDIARTFQNLGFLYEYRGDYKKAWSNYDKAISIYSMSSNQSGVARVWIKQARLSLTQGDPEEGEKLARAALKVLRENYTIDHWRIADAESVLGACLARRGGPFLEEAESLLIQSQTLLEETKGTGSFYNRDALDRLIDFYETVSEQPQRADLYREKKVSAIEAVQRIVTDPCNDTQQ